MWKIKDPAIKEKIMQLLSDESIAKRCKDQMTDGSTYILAADDDQKFSISMDKDLFENVPEYTPEGWNPFPALMPPRPGNYLVYLNGRFDHQIRVSYFNTNSKSWDQYSGAVVLAFRELEIEPPNDDVLKFSAYKLE
jgi:hypothetical protein